MTTRGFYTLLGGVLMLFTALSVGSAGAFLLGAAALCTLALSLLSALITACTCRIAQEASALQAARGEQVVYTLRIRLFSPLPAAPLSLRLCLPSGKESEFRLNASLIGETVSESAFTCPHVGVCRVGVTQATVSDCFSFFRFTRKVRAPLLPITVLPNPAQADMPAFSPGEGEHSASQRAQSDRTTPVDTRPWQDGDDMKRVHWKLSMRKQALMVHTYETPQRPDALVLLDGSTPLCADGRRAQMIDALTEACAGVIRVLLEAGHPVRMPLGGQAARELAGQDGSAMHAMLEALAIEPFDAPPEFERVLMLCARRMRTTGSTVIVTSRLTPRIADMALALMRMGPRLQFTLVTDGRMSEQQDKLMHLLRANGADAHHISLAP